MDANRRSRIKMSSRSFIIFFLLFAFVGVEDLQSGVSNNDSCYVMAYNWTANSMIMCSANICARPPAVSYTETEIDVSDVYLYLDVHYILSFGHVPMQFLEQNVKDVCYILLFVIMLWLLWRQDCQKAKLQSDFTFLAHQLSTTSLTLHQFIPELQECKQNLSSMKMFTKELQTLYTIADENAQELKSVSAELSTWKSTWERREQKQKKRDDKYKAATNTQEVFLTAALFTDFLKWNDAVISHVYSLLMSHKRQLDYMYINRSMNQHMTGAGSRARMPDRNNGAKLHN